MQRRGLGPAREYTPGAARQRRVEKKYEFKNLFNRGFHQSIKNRSKNPSRHRGLGSGNGLLANVGLPQVRRGTYEEKPLITAGEDINQLKRFLEGSNTSYSATEVVDFLLEDVLR